MKQLKRKLPSSWSEQEDQYLKDHYRSTPFYLIAEALGRTRPAVSARAFILGLKRTKEEQREITLKYNRSRFRKGQAAWNKGMKGLNIGGEHTRFKKGQQPHNTLQDGAVSVRIDKRGVSYKWVRISKGKWEYLHRQLWQEKYGPIPKGKILRCKSDDTLNTDPDNWYLTDRKKHMEKNSGPLNLSDTYVAALLSVRKPELREQLLQQPELIEVARLNYQLKREISKKK